jgi:hypothetical protein
VSDGVLRFIPAGCVDALYGAIQDDDCENFAQLSNLIPAPDTNNHWVPRPAATYLATSSSIASCQTVIGSVVYGMRASVTYPGYDEPFAYNLLSQTYISITGVSSSAVLPASLSAGAWRPPHAEPIGAYVIITHVGFTGSGSQFFGAINITTPATPAWTIQNTTTNALPSVPVWCTAFNSRAYYFCNPTGTTPAVLASDNFAAGGPLSRSGAVAAVILTFDDNTPLTCGAVMSLTSSVQGGVIQAMYVFKDPSVGTTNIYQVTGDSALTTLIRNALSVQSGTIAPNTVVPTPTGLFFCAPDGLRFIDFNGQINPPVGYSGQGINNPFIYATYPSRMAAACNGSTYRITTQNSNLSGSPNQDWCYDLNKRIWYGPHTFNYGLISAWGTSFIVTPTLASGNTGFYQSNVVPGASDTFIELGKPMQAIYQTCLAPDRKPIMELSSVKSVFYNGYGAGTTTFNISVLDQQGVILAFATNSVTISQVNWDQFSWGDNTLINSQSFIGPLDVTWSQPFVFDRAAVLIVVTNITAGLRLANFHLAYSETQYTVKGSGQ